MHGRWIAVDLEDSGIPLFALGYFTGIIRRRVSISLHDPFDRVVFEGSTRWKKTREKRKEEKTQRLGTVPFEKFS